MSKIHVLEGETPLFCGCCEKAVMLTVDSDGSFILRREWHGDTHMRVLTPKQILDILARRSQNPT